MVSRVKAGKALMTLDAEDRPLAPRVLGQASALACVSEQGRVLVFGINEMKTLAGGGRGVIVMALADKEKLLAVQPISETGVRVVGVGRAGKVQELVLSASGLAPHIGKRARKGKALNAKIKVTDLRSAQN